MYIGDMIDIKDLKKILNKYSDNDYLMLSITSFDEEGATAEVFISTEDDEDDSFKRVILKDEASEW